MEKDTDLTEGINSMSDLIERQAAIDAVENGCQEWKGIFQRCEANIKNLPDFQDTNVGDTISRQAAIDVLHGYFDGMLETDTWSPCDVYGLIEILPSAEPERKKGKWIDAVIPNDNGGLPVQVCDQCNTFFPLAYTGGGHRFCPNCGADMRGGQNEND
jgi:hypothetical protein